MSLSDEPQYASLTPTVVQIRWKVPTEFPACPEIVSEHALEEYAARLTFGSVFAQNGYNRSLVVNSCLTGDSLVVLTRFGDEAVKDWAVAHVSIKGRFFCHRSEATFFELQGALKHFCELTGQEYGDPIDDYC
ncbi:hypothetical protein [Mesorhizobium shangrilense]|uniref:Uncharacterized protein n=1 Tax=Mesorhizobium shangrilense TaxID=460060 RepID=A0ABV2DNB5_9HYPH